MHDETPDARRDRLKAYLKDWRAKNKHRTREKDNARSKAWREANPERAKALCAAWHITNAERVRAARQKRGTSPEQKARARARYAAEPEAARARSRAWRAANTEHARALTRTWIKANPGRMNAHGAAYRANRLQATPPWVDHAAIRQVYDLAALLGMHVDHIHPLKGKNFCGLHVPWNLQLLTASQNSAKGNRLPETNLSSV